MKILIIDDDEDIRILLREFLEEWFKLCGQEVKVILAKDGEEGLAIFRKSPTDFKLIITDRRIPRMSGEELIRNVRLMKINVKTILISGDPDIIPVAKAAGANEVLSKPFNLKDLKKIIQKLS
jgi:CheY-like chemotaxis protein